MAYTVEHPPFAVTADAVVLTLRDGKLCALVITRGRAPFAGRLALPGGFVDIDESVDHAVRRELAEETGLELKPRQLEQLGAYGAPDRDPRMRTVSVAYLALLPEISDVKAGDDASDVQCLPVSWLLARRDRLAFDHRLILRDGADLARHRLG